MKNNTTKYYIAGLLSGLLFIPILEEFTNVVMAWIQALLIKPNKIVLQGNKELSELQMPEEESQTNCIGFEIPNVDYDDEYEE